MRTFQPLSMLQQVERRMPKNGCRKIGAVHVTLTAAIGGVISDFDYELRDSRMFSFILVLQHLRKLLCFHFEAISFFSLCR